MEVYFDNSATTRCSRRVQEIVIRTMDADYGNPSSLHRKGIEAEAYVKEAAEAIAKTLKVSAKEIYFTSGGTESNNLAILGTAFANKRAGKRILTTQVEHASVLQAMAFLETQGFEVIYLPVDSHGMLSLEALQDAIDEQTILVSVMQVNNEIGTVEPVAQAAHIIKQKNPRALFHVDAVQSYGKMQIRPQKLGIDLLSVSGHKIHGPKGVGFLYIRDKTKIMPLSFGGGQQSGMRSGTHNVPGIAGLGEAASEAYEDIDQKIEYLYHLRNLFLTRIARIPDVTVHGFTKREEQQLYAPHIVSIAAAGVRSEVLLHALEEHDIYISAGSACSSNKPSVSRTLQAIHTAPPLLDATVRFSFSIDNQEEEIDYAVKKMEELLPKLRRYRYL